MQPGAKNSLPGDPAPLERGVHVHRHPRLEALAKRLLDALRSDPPANPLAMQTVIVAHPGMARWLRNYIAKACGIAANLHLPQPWQWLDQAASVALGETQDDIEPWRRQNLRWRIFAQLPRIDDARLQSSLSGDDAARRRFQLAERLADLFAQYALYRPDWIGAWERAAPPGNWQAALWRRVRQAIGTAHRASRQRELLDRLAGQGSARAALHVFGVNHLPPASIDALQAISMQRAVHLYFPDPCEVYWSGDKSQRALLQMGDAAHQQYHECGHPLLSSLGRMAQDFLLALEQRGIDYGADPESAPRTAPQTLLGALQASIESAAPQCLQEVQPRRADASLRVHACATRLRELEVLRDALLGLLADDPDLAPQDIVVMAPDIGAYAPLLPAVFGAAMRHDGESAHLPWHLVDVGLAAGHPLVRAFAGLLDLAQSRFRLSEVLDLLAVPAIARRAGLAGHDRARLENLLRRAGVAWGLDATAKARVGGAAIAANSWQFGFDRLFAGLIVGSDDDAQLLDGILPLGGNSAEDAVALGQLHALLQVLRGMVEGFATPRELPEWCDWLARRIEALFAADAQDAAEEAALQALREVLGALRAQDPRAACGALEWSVVREALRGALQSIPERQAFLLGGVTFCGMIPQRSIPFKVVCLLGMNEGEFPRRGSDDGLNLMRREPRPGDRDTRREDRYLFLEALMAARVALHASFIAVDLKTGKSRNPAAPLAELLQMLDECHAGNAGSTAPWRVVHAAQPHDARYYTGGDPALFSFAAAYAAGAEPGPAPVPFARGVLHAEPRVQTRVDLDGLRRFWRDPPQLQLRELAGLALEGGDANAATDREPMNGSIDRLLRVERRLLLDALHTDLERLPQTAPDWLACSGALAQGPLGAAAYEAARERAQSSLTMAREQLGGGARREIVAVDLEIGGVRVQGTVRDVLRQRDGRLQLFAARIGRLAGFKDLLPFYIDWACLKLSAAGVAGACFIEQPKDKAPRQPALLDAMLGQDNAQLRAGLQALVEMAQSARTRALLFPAESAWAWCNPGSKRGPVEAAQQAWFGSGDFSTGESAHSPGYAALLLRDAAWLDARTVEGAQFARTCECVASILDPARSAERAP